MPRRAPIDPFGIYHVGTRGVYGQPLFRARDEYELFLSQYTKVAGKYGWRTLEWVLMLNHHHFVVRLTNGGLSEGMRVLHGGFSRRIHAIYGLTNQGHLVRHGFFARELESDADVIGTCRYIALNPWRARGIHPAQAGLVRLRSDDRGDIPSAISFAPGVARTDLGEAGGRARGLSRAGRDGHGLRGP